MSKPAHSLDRRHFLAALAASVVAAGAALPVGFPKEIVMPAWIQVTVRFADEASEAQARKEMPWLFQYTGDDIWEVEARKAA